MSDAVADRVGPAWRYGVARPNELAGRSGLEFLRAMLAGDLPAPPIGETLGFEPTLFEPGLAEFVGSPQSGHYNPLGSVHGGYAATLLDSCMGCAVQTLLDAGEGFTTLELKVSFSRPMTSGTGRVRAIGTALHRGRRVAFAEGRLLDADDRLIAHGTSTCLILQLDQRGVPR